MRDPEFHVQVLCTEPQWQSGLISGLSLDPNGITLFAIPAFKSWLVEKDGRFGDIVTDDCSQTYWTARDTVDGSSVWCLFRYDPRTRQVERLVQLETCQAMDPQRLWLARFYIWILDRKTNRLLAFSRENFQVVFEISVGERLIDVDFDRRAFFYALLGGDGDRRICRYPLPPETATLTDCFTLKQWKHPVALAVAPDGRIYVLDADLGRFLRFSPQDNQEQVLGAPPKDKITLEQFQPSVMEIDERGVVFLGGRQKTAAEGDSAELHQFDADGSYLGKVRLPSEIKEISGIGFDRQDGVYLATNHGLAKLSLAITPVGQSGVYYARALDNGIPQGPWHRLELQGQLPPRTSVEVFYHASDSSALKAAYEQALSSPSSAQEKVAQVEKLLGPLWKEPELFSGAAEPLASVGSKRSRNPVADMLFLESQGRSNKGRYLWLKLRLSTFDEKSRASIQSARIFYPRLSYLRYLPPTYREDQVSAAFLERFLSLFETVFQGIEAEIDQLFRHFDPETAPPEFLPWLASWIGLSIDEDLRDEQIRRLIRRAPVLYSGKGTPAGLVEFLQIYTGRPVSLTEHSRRFTPFLLGGGDTRLGRGTVLVSSAVQGFRLGDSSVVGYGVLRDRDRQGTLEEPFLSIVRRFTVLVDMSREEFTRREGTLRRILNEQAPAHTAFSIELVSNRGFAGAAVLGVSAVVTDYEPFRVGFTPLGRGTAVAEGPPVLRVERGAWVGTRSGL